MKEIKLTRGKYAIVDDEDYERIMNSEYRWYAMKTHGIYYAYGVSVINNSRILMHRLILDFPKTDIDHIDHNGLNNSRSNLREASHTLNLGNSRLRKDNTTGFKGVQLHYGKYRARIHFNHQLIELGSYDDPKEAAGAYNTAAQKYFREFANLNVL